MNGSYSGFEAEGEGWGLKFQWGGGISEEAWLVWHHGFITPDIILEENIKWNKLKCKRMPISSDTKKSDERKEGFSSRKNKQSEVRVTRWSGRLDKGCKAPWSHSQYSQRLRVPEPSPHLLPFHVVSSVPPALPPATLRFGWGRKEERTNIEY